MSSSIILWRAVSALLLLLARMYYGMGCAVPATGSILSAEILYGVTMTRGSATLRAPMALPREDTAAAVPKPALGVSSMPVLNCLAFPMVTGSIQAMIEASAKDR